MSFRDQAFDDWVERARQVSVRGELERRGLWTRKMLGDAGNPCPGCGGTDRFAVNLRKDLFFCRRSGAGGDAIALVRHVDDVAFLRAVEILTGETPPSGEEAESEVARAQRIARLEERGRAQAEAARKQQAEGERYRGMERQAAFDLWLAGTPIPGTPAATYLDNRGLVVPREARFKFHPNVDYFWGGAEYDTRTVRAKRLFAGPALLAGIYDAGGFFIGVHRTWLDPNGPDGKKLITDPATGEVLPAKKVRGSMRGGLIPLAGFPPAAFAGAAPRPSIVAARMIMGEGTETTLSPYAALPAAERRDTYFAAGVSLGNLAGKAKGRLPHPSDVRLDSKGRGRRVFVPDDVPLPDDDTPLIGIPDSVTELVLLGDGDSDPFATGLALRRAGTRYADAYPGVTVKLAMARPGLDFNAMLREAA